VLVATSYTSSRRRLHPLSALDRPSRRSDSDPPFDASGNIVTGDRILPVDLPDDPDPVLASFFDYYRTDRGYHPRSVNSNTAWTATTPMPFFAFPLMNSIELIEPRRVMLVAGADAHSRYYAEDVHDAGAGFTELVIVPDADHVDLYDRKDRIPFDQLETFFHDNLK
jgi:fermentation-respiration switch protein FrsA (DUF1100 family)